MRLSFQSLFNLILAIGLLGLYVLYFNHRPLKLAYVESAKVLDSYGEMQTARQHYRQQVEGWQANLDTLKHTVQQELDTYNQQRARLTPSQRREQEARLGQRQKQYLSYKQALTQKAADEETRITAEVVRKADGLMKQYGRDHGYDLILAATDAGTIVYGREGRDITAEVIQALNKRQE